MSAVTPDAAALLFARTLIGLAIGADSTIATAYIAEYAPKEPARLAGHGGQTGPEVGADLVVLVGENLGEQVTEAHRLTPPHTGGFGSWLSTSGCGSATSKTDGALPRSGRGSIHVQDGAWMGAD
jgi:MFS family permease